MERILIDGAWRDASAAGDFAAINPVEDRELPERYPVSAWTDLERALTAATAAAPALSATDPGRIATFFEDYATRIESARAELVACAALETGLPIEPRLNSVELPRTTNQLRLAARAVRERSWMLPVIDVAANIRACHGPLAAPVVVFGPNNFPLAFNAIAGSDLASAIAARNPVIAKVHPSHPGTSRRLAELAFEAVRSSGLPAATVQMLYHCSNDDGRRLVSDARVGAIGFTGSRTGGLALKKAADAAGRPIYLELSSINPIFLLPGALAERGAALAQEFQGSCLLGSGQFCTNPGVLVLPDDEAADRFVGDAVARFDAHPPALLLNRGVRDHLHEALAALVSAGARVRVGGAASGPGVRFQATLLDVDAPRFIADPRLQTEAFGPVSLLVRAQDAAERLAVARALQGNLTASVYSALDGADDDEAATLSAILRPRVGRLLNDKMPTGVAVSAAMVHGGPYPATGHPGFTAVGMPAAIRRFTALQCYDGVRDVRLPPELQDANSLGIPRCVDGRWIV